MVLTSGSLQDGEGGAGGKLGCPGGSVRGKLGCPGGSVMDFPVCEVGILDHLDLFTSPQVRGWWGPAPLKVALGRSPFLVLSLEPHSLWSWCSGRCPVLTWLPLGLLALLGGTTLNP